MFDRRIKLVSIVGGGAEFRIKQAHIADLTPADIRKAADDWRVQIGEPFLAGGSWHVPIQGATDD
ncbi:hypothetical protein [Subtercola vilae]|uniref:Uncharacterized protein n=1 Tax=Subtercola vilae TaxID=2056433 RepID=A0A4T2BUZ6_9MICO|nr:hypothetical protein [Subtercola vilae]TIH34949.1 hypothetical protein D4765_11680 [Subtercola vilae]